LKKKENSGAYTKFTRERSEKKFRKCKKQCNVTDYGDVESEDCKVT